jgi:hypothetical protein
MKVAQAKDLDHPFILMFNDSYIKFWFETQYMKNKDRPEVTDVDFKKPRRQPEWDIRNYWLSTGVENDN